MRLGAFILAISLWLGAPAHAQSSWDLAVQLEKAADGKRRAELAEIASIWTPQQKAAFVRLQACAEAFFNAHVDDERSSAGSSQAFDNLTELSRMRDAFLATVKEFEAGKRPPKDDFVEADRDLNRLYRKILARDGWADEAGPVQPDGIHKAERIWIPYRDSWAAFAATRYPDTPASTWKAWITHDRIKTVGGA